MNFTSRYEFFIAHIVPGVLGLLGIMLIIENYFVSGLTSFIFQKMTTWNELPIIILVISPLVLFMGLFLDGIKSIIVGPLFRKWINRKVDSDYLTKLETITREKYDMVLDEYYYYYESAVNCALALILIAIALPNYLLNIGKIDCHKMFTIYFIFLLLVLLLFIIGYKHYSSYTKTMDTLSKGSKG